MRVEIMTKVLEEKLKPKLDLLESRNRVHNEDITFCEKLVDDINSKIINEIGLLKLCNNTFCNEERTSETEMSDHNIKQSNIQSSRKESKFNSNMKQSQRTLETKQTEKSLKVNNKLISNDTISNASTKKQTRNSSAQKNFSIYTKGKKNEEENKNLLVKKIQPKTPKGDRDNNFKPFNKFNSQKNLGSKLDTSKNIKNSETRGNGDLTPLRKEDKSIRKLSSCIKIEKEKIVPKDNSKQTNKFIQIENNNQNSFVVDSFKEESQKLTIEKNTSTIEKVDEIIESHNELIKEAETKKEKIIDFSSVFIDNFKKISIFLNKIDILKFYSANNTCNKLCREILYNIVETDINNLQEKVKNLTEKYNNTLELSKEIPPFNIPRGTVKAVELLNDTIYVKLFMQPNIPIPEILFPYKVFFQLLQHPMCNSKTESEFWEECCKFFLADTTMKTGDLINNVIKNFVFTEENIYKVYKICEGKEKRINPSGYSKICGTTGLIIFVIRDALEYAGIIVDKKTLPACLRRLYSSCLDKANENLNNLKSFEKK